MLLVLHMPAGMRLPLTQAANLTGQQRHFMTIFQYIVQKKGPDRLIDRTLTGWLPPDLQRPCQTLPRPPAELAQVV